MYRISADKLVASGIMLSKEVVSGFSVRSWMPLPLLPHGDGALYTSGYAIAK